MLQISACSRNDDTEHIAVVAKQAYDSLFSGNTYYFIHAHYDIEGLPRKMVEERMENMKQFLNEQVEEHGGVKAIRVSHAVVDDTLRTANAFLIFCYGDSTNEEIVVPMIECNGTWLLR